MVKFTTKIQLTTIIMVFVFQNLKAENKCSLYQRLWNERKYSYIDELKILSSKDFSSMCPKSDCCDNNMKNEMVGVSQLKLKSLAQSHLKTITGFLLNNSNTFIDYFHNNLELSKNQLHQMFLNTYSNKYQTNQPFFFEFYDKLKSYMNGKEQNIEKILETFFHDMAEKILVMMDVARKDSETVRCLTNNFLKMNPYQSIDKNIISHFKEAYPTARMMVNSLKAAHDVFLEISNKMTPSLECSTDYAKAFYCSLCSATEVQPCEALCRSMIGKCFGSLNSKETNKLNKAWKSLMMTIEKIAKKLKHPFNYVEVNKNLHVKISDAIMNVQGFFPSVREKIWENCKTHRIRRRRSDDGNYNQYFENLPKSMDNVQLKAADFSEIVDKFSSQISGMVAHLQKSKNIICSSNFKLPKSGEKCWNGAEITSNYVPKQKDKGQQKNLALDPIIRKNINKLNNIAQTLNNLLSKKNIDPEAFKITFIEKPKKIEIPRTRQSRISEPSIEGSGAGDTENSNTKPKPEIPAPVENNKPSENIEGSGNKKSPSENKDNKNRPSFPEFPTKVSPPKPRKPVKKPITDDEDISNQNENENNKINKPTDPNKAIEGSGSLENSEKTTEKSSTIITTTTTLEPITEPKKFGKESINTEGSGQSADDDSPPSTPEDKNIRHRYLEIEISTTTDQTTTASILQPNDLPGEIPNEIWIPRIIDDDSRNQVMDNSNSRSWNIKPCVTSISVAVTVSMISIYRLLSW